MMRIGERVDYLSLEGIAIFRVKSTLGSTIISICAAFFFFMIIDSYWIFLPFALYILITRFGFCDFIFDEKDNVFRKRYGIFNFYLGDSYRLKGLDKIEIKAVSAYEASIGKIADYDQLFVINLFYMDKKLPIYASQDQNFIRELFNKISLINRIRTKWDTNIPKS